MGAFIDSLGSLDLPIDENLIELNAMPFALANELKRFRFCHLWSVNKEMNVVTSFAHHLALTL